MHVIQMADEWESLPSTSQSGDIVDLEDGGVDGCVHSTGLERQEPGMVQDEESGSGKCCGLFVSMNIIKTALQRDKTEFYVYIQVFHRWRDTFCFRY